MRLHQKSLGILFLAGLLVVALSPTVFSQQHCQEKFAKEAAGMTEHRAMTMSHGGHKMTHGAVPMKRCPGSTSRMNMMSHGGMMTRMSAMSDQMGSLMEDMSSIMGSKMMKDNELKTSLQKMREQMKQIRNNMMKETEDMHCLSRTVPNLHKGKDVK